jgi:NAD(P)-dependent dehydrogenase (short-subunit alcohol dehydrogenase family)
VEINGVGALVTGGASGLGAATSQLLAGAGAKVTIADVNVELGRKVAFEIDAEFIECDVRQEDAVKRAVDVASSRSPKSGLRLAVACAGIGLARKIASRSLGPHPLVEFVRVIDLNLIGTFNLMRLAASSMLDNEPNADGERGLLVNTASAAAYEGQAGQVAYAASKGAIVSMTLTAARDLARDGIRVVTIAPGVFDTAILERMSDEQRSALAAQPPFPTRLGRPDEYGALVLAIAGNSMLNGETIRIDGALRMPPR